MRKHAQLLELEIDMLGTDITLMNLHSLCIVCPKKRAINGIKLRVPKNCSLILWYFKERSTEAAQCVGIILSSILEFCMGKCKVRLNIERYTQDEVIAVIGAFIERKHGNTLLMIR